MQHLSLRLLHSVARCASAEELLGGGLPEVASAVGARFVGLFVATDGVWRLQATSASDRDTPAGSDPPRGLLADTADSGQRHQQGAWQAIPLRDTLWPSAVLVAYEATGELSPEIATTLSSALQIVDAHHRQALRGRRLEALLDIAANWNRTLDMRQLFAQMAEVATDLLAAERATVFLWDRRHKTLIGRPAHGVEGDELRIPDTTGVAGRVLHTGQPHRAGREGGEDDLSREIDRMLQLETRNILCVPLLSDSGKIMGAFELINKREGAFTEDDEVELSELASQAAAAIENCQNYQQLLTSSKRQTAEVAAHAKLLGTSPAIEKIRDSIRRVAPSDLAVLILGENGTGKEIASRMIHVLSHRGELPFLAVNCAALTETLLESELFGHEKGAFTDAHETRAGKFELAAGGTLFLDEIGELPLSSQSKLLRVLDEKVVVRLGGTAPLSTDARVVAATNRDLATLVRERLFREDLFFRLNVVTLELPPLRQRGDDILLLAEHFLGDFCLAARRDTPQFTPAAKQLLLNHAWPGNVRELRNLMERVAYLSSGGTLDAEYLQLSTDSFGTNANSPLPLNEATRQFQIDYIEQQIQSTVGNMTEAARRLGLHRSNLYRKMGQLGMSQSDES